ncbi:unnamed protein product [Symbiodinium sp. CCMP2456]|nr:unnamed protein product [Symbiodinium sp. CCMP2456]
MPAATAELDADGGWAQPKLGSNTKPLAQRRDCKRPLEKQRRDSSAELSKCGGLHAMGRSGRGRVVKESRAEEEGAQDALREVPTPLRGGRATVKTPVNALEEVMRRRGVDEAWDALEQMHADGKTTDKYTVSRMLMKTVGDGQAHLDPTRAYRGIALVERFIEMQPEDVDEVLFNALLDTCCRLKDLKRLESCVSWMRQLRVKPSPITLGILVKTYGQAGDLEKVLAAWDEMEEQRGLANSVTYGCMLDACVKCGNLQKAVEVFRGMRATGKHRNTILYTTMIKGYGLHKELENALELFHEMREEGVPYNTITYNSILEACVKCGDIVSAENILEQMVQTEMEIVPDLISYSTVLKGYCQNGELLKALCMFDDMKERRLRSDELVYNTLMEGCVKADDWKAGCGLFAEMVSCGLRPSAITASILSRLFQRVGHEDADERVTDLFAAVGLEKPQPAERPRASRRGQRSPAASPVEASPSVTDGLPHLVSQSEMSEAPLRQLRGHLSNGSMCSVPPSPMSPPHAMGSPALHGHMRQGQFPAVHHSPLRPHGETSDQVKHSRVPSLASMLPPVENRYQEKASFSQGGAPLPMDGSFHEACSSHAGQVPIQFSPALKGTSGTSSAQPSLASLLRQPEEVYDQQGHRHSHGRTPSLATLLAPLDGLAEGACQKCDRFMSDQAQPSPGATMPSPVGLVGVADGKHDQDMRQAYGHAVPTLAAMLSPMEASRDQALPTPTRTNMSPDGQPAPGQMPLSPASMLLSAEAAGDQASPVQLFGVHPHEELSSMRQSYPTHSQDHFQSSYFSQDMWSYFPDRHGRW